MNFKKEIAVGQAAIKKSGKLLLEYFEQEKLVRHSKGINDFATEADLASEKLIIDSIRKHFPSHSIISEEMGHNDNKSDFRWIIDPLDGTKNFASHIPTWGPMIALQHKNEIVFSAIFLPVAEELCIAGKNKGTFLNGKKVTVSKNENAKDSVYFCGLRNYKNPAIKESFEKITKKFFGQLCMINSIGAGAVLTASGRMDAIIAVGFSRDYIWDVAPAYLVIKEAGGIITDIDNIPWSLSSSDFIAANSRIHELIISALK